MKRNKFHSVAVIPIKNKSKRLPSKNFKKLGADYLKPIYNALSGTVSYDELQVLRIYYLAEDKNRITH